MSALIVRRLVHFARDCWMAKKPQGNENKVKDPEDKKKMNATESRAGDT